MGRLSWGLQVIRNVITSISIKKKKKKTGEDLVATEEDNMMGFPVGPGLNNTPCDAGDKRSIPGP